MSQKSVYSERPFEILPLCFIQYRIVQLLLEKTDIDVNYVNRDGRNALHYASIGSTLSLDGTFEVIKKKTTFVLFTHVDTHSHIFF